MNPPKASSAEILLARGRAAWAAQDTAKLAALQVPDSVTGMQRGVIALLASTGQLQAANDDGARRLGKQALREGLDPRLLGLAWLAAVESDLAEAGASNPAARRDRATRWRSEVLKRADAAAAAEPPTRLSKAREEAQRLREEVMRQRSIIDELRASRDQAQRLREEVMRQRSIIDELRTSQTVRAAAPDDDRPDPALIDRILASRLSYLSLAKMRSIARTVRAIEGQHIPGTFLEAGCALGGSAILIASLKSATRRFEVYDVFGMIPPPSEEDTADVHERYRVIVEGRSQGIGGDRYYGYETGLLNIVQRNFEDFGLSPAECGVHFVQGLIQDTLHSTGPVALAHLDLDWYDPVMVCLERIWPRLSLGGSIIVDDYHDWGGCRRAVDRFVDALQTGYIADDSAGSLKLTKVRA